MSCGCGPSPNVCKLLAPSAWLIPTGSPPDPLVNQRRRTFRKSKIHIGSAETHLQISDPTGIQYVTRSTGHVEWPYFNMSNWHKSCHTIKRDLRLYTDTSGSPKSCIISLFFFFRNIFQVNMCYMQVCNYYLWLHIP